MTYARSRLWLGMSAVGTIVLVATVILATQGYSNLLGVPGGADGREFMLLAEAVGLWATVMIPFDFVGGYLLPKRFERSVPSLPQFVLRWARGVLVQSGLIAIFLWCILQAAQFGGLFAAIITVVMAQMGLIACQKHVASMVARLRSPDAGPCGFREQGFVVATSSSDTGFTGSIVGLPGFEKVIVPESWVCNLNAEQLTAEITRRRGAIQTGSRTRGVVLAFAVNTLTFAVCTQLPFAGVLTVSELLSASLYFTLASFVWLLILPRWSREGVFEADRFAVETGVPVELLKETAESIESLHDDESKRSRQLESVFHPIPCVKRRVAELSLRIRSFRGFWNVARMTLFLSWSCGGFLSRAVHCNIGRPELWVMLPAD